MLENSASLFSAFGLGYLVITAWPLAKTDIIERRLPNKYVLPAFPVTLLGQILAGVFAGIWWNMLWAFIAAAITFLLSLLVNRLGLLGMGDVKLMTAMALALGWYSPFLPAISLILTFIFAGLVALSLLFLGRLKRGGSMPLGPYLIAGFIAAVSLVAWS